MAIKIKIGLFDEPIMIIINHGFDINIMTWEIYKKEKWSIHTNHG